MQTEVELNSGHTIKSVKVLGGCDGNLKGIASLLPGMKTGRHHPHGGHPLRPQGHQLPRPDQQAPKGALAELG